MTKFKAVLSDIDGTLADSEGLALKAFQKVCTQLGAEMSHEEADTYIGVALEDKFEQVRHRFDQDIEFDAFFERILAHYHLNADEITIFPGARELLKDSHAAGMRVGAVTNANALEADIKIQELGDEITDILEFTIAVEDIARPKPAPDGYLEGARRMGIDPKDIIVFEDTRGGVAAAKAAGMTVIQIQPDDSLVNDNADLVVSSIDDPAIAKFMGLPPKPAPATGPKI
ncbi:MAG: HAD family phosphatase [Pseudomonadota bacterium]